MTRRNFWQIIPSPLALAMVLTLVVMVAAVLVTKPDEAGLVGYTSSIFNFWYSGFWGLLAFTMQMMVILVMGHVLALTPLVTSLINRTLSICRTQASLLLFVTLLTMIIGFFNWGMGLIFGAVMSRKAAEWAQQRKIAVNYPLLGAAGYSGMMIWHGGLSGSAPLKVAEPGHFLAEQMGVLPVRETLFSPMNLTLSAILLVVIPLTVVLAGRVCKRKIPEVAPEKDQQEKVRPSWLLIFFGGLMLLAVAAYVGTKLQAGEGNTIISLNFVNFLLFALALVLSYSFARFTAAIDEAVVGAAGILVQFPLYAGIMGIMAERGLLEQVTTFFISTSNEVTFPLVTFLSAGLVNVFVPSGGGQWAVQGPVVVEAARELGVSLPKVVMALAYGDQITNMLQPFWALPLLAVTGLKAQEILPYTLLMMLVASVVFVAGLLVF